ncbi:MAG TPA: Maf family protein, partial [Nitriliruptorales bacterium]
MAPPRLLLASASPRRRALLDGIGLRAIAQDPRVPEADVEGPAETRVRVLAARKAEAVAAAVWSGWVVGADTLGTLDGMALAKPTDDADAVRMLRHLSGRTHEVVTGVAVLRCDNGVVVDRAEAVVSTRVR